MDLSLHRLRLLAELERRGTVTAAARALSYTVSAVSQQLSHLEKEVGTALFEKQGRRIVLTPAGVLLAGHARTILAAVDDATSALDAADSGLTTSITVGVWASVASGLLPNVLSRLQSEHPGIDVRTRELAPEDTAGAVLDGSLDLSFVIDYSSYPMPWTAQLSRHTVAVESMHAALPSGAHPGGPVSLTELAEKPWILSGPRSHFGRAVRMACQEFGVEPSVQHEVGEQSTALAMVAAGLGVTLVSDLGLSLRPEGVDVVPLKEDFTRTVSIAARARTDSRQSLRAFTEAVAAAAAEVGLRPL